MEYEDILDLLIEFNNPLKVFGVANFYEKANKAVNQLINLSLGDSAIFNVVKLLDDNNIKVVMAFVSHVIPLIINPKLINN